MPRYYCDYCDTYLTHDSPVVRKQHNTGYKHKANVRNYYSQFEEAKTQDEVDSKIMEHLARLGAGGAPGQPLGGLPGMPPPGVGGYNPIQLPPPGLPPPAGYGPPPGSMPYQRPPSFPPPQSQPYRPPPSQYGGYPPPPH